MTCNSICDACDTVRHCSKHGCVPVQPMVPQRVSLMDRLKWGDDLSAESDDILATRKSVLRVELARIEREVERRKPKSGIVNCFVKVKEGDAPFSDQHIRLDGYAIVPLADYRALEAAANGGGRL